MSRGEYAQEVISQAASSMGLPPLEFDERACIQVKIGDLPLTIMHSTKPAEMLWLFANLAPVPDDPAQLRGLLRLGFVTWLSGQMTLGLDDEARRLIGYTVIPLSTLTAAHLKMQIEQLQIGRAEIVDRLNRFDFEFASQPETERQTASQGGLRP